MHSSSKSLFARRALWASAALALFAVSAGAKVLDDTIASVNGQPVLLSEYKKNLKSVLEQYKDNMPKLLEDKDAVQQIRQKVLDQMVDDELLAQHAEKVNIKVTEREIDNGVTEIKDRFKADESGKPLSAEAADAAFEKELRKEGLGIPAFRERLKRQVRVRKFIEESIRPKVEAPTESDARAYFQKMDFVVKGDTSVLSAMPPSEAQAVSMMAGRLKDLGAERVRARHILVKVPPNASMVDKSQALNKIKDLRKKLQDGADFAELAQKNSDDAESAKKGGDLGFFLRGWMVPEFEKAAFSLPVGEVSDVVESQFGYHLIRVEEKKAAHKPAFEEVEDQLMQAIYGLRVQKTLEDTVKDLRSKATIEVLQPVDKVSLQ